MVTYLPADLLLRISRRIETAIGLHFPQERLRELDRKIRLAARELAFLDPVTFAQWILSSPFADDQIRMLAGYLHVEETYFFRDLPVWGILQNSILQPLIASREGTNQRLRLWSASCHTGEEAYSIAITLARTALPHRQDWKCSILATDMSPDALRCAKLGIYSPWSFRGTSPDIRARYFRPLTNGQFAIRPEIRQMVTFAQANLLSSTPIPNSGLMDVIFCRNVLLYFTPERVERVLKRFYDTLSDGGWLIVGPEESTYLTASPFVPVMKQGITVYRKELRPYRKSVVFPAARTETSSSTPRALPPRVFPPLAAESPQLHSEAPSSPAASPGSAPPEMPYEQAYALYEQGQYEQVVTLLLPRCRAGEDPHSLFPISIQEFSLLTRAFINQGYYLEAQHCCERALRHDQSNPSLHYLLATIFLEQERIPDAVQAFHKLISLHPDCALAHFALGNVLQQQHRHDEATPHLANALTILRRTSPDEVMPETTGLTAGRLTKLVEVMLRR